MRQRDATLDLFTPVVPREQMHPNFLRVAGEDDDGVRSVLRGWAEGFVDRDGKFVEEFQRTFNSSWWELYLNAVLKSLDVRVDYRFDAPDFVTADAGFAIEATIANHARDARPEWLKTQDDVANPGDVSGRYLDQLARLSNSLGAKVGRYRDRYRALPYMADRSFVVAIHNFGTPDFFQLGDVAMQRLLYDVWDEREFLKDGRIPLSTGLFLDGGIHEVSAVIYSSLATFGKARALSDSKGVFLFDAVRIRNNVELIHVVERHSYYRESLRDGLRVFHNPYASHPLPEHLFDVDDVRQFRVRDGGIETTSHPAGDLCVRQVIHLVERPD